MKAASIRFFELPELVGLVASFLPKGSLAQFTRTDIVTYQTCSPVLYRDLDFHFTYRTPNTSPAFLQGLSKNMHHIRSFTMDGTLFTLLFAGLMALQDLNSAASGTSPDRPSWLPSPRLHHGFVMPLPPMTFLTSFSCNNQSLDIHTRDDVLEEDYTSGAYLAQVCYAIRLSPHLVRLELQNVPLYDPFDVDLLCATISRLTKLESVVLTINSFCMELRHAIVPMLFFSCPPDLVCFNVNLQLESSATGNTASAIPQRPSKTLDQPRIQRQQPLHRLTGWTGSESEKYDRETMCAIIQHCPALTELDIPRIRRRKDFEFLARFIVDNCPRLNDLTQRHWYRDEDGFLMAAIIEAMPENRLERVFAEDIGSDNERLLSSFQRHSLSLTELSIHGCDSLSSHNIQVIVCNMHALKDFIIIGESSKDHAITLDDAIAAPWVCTRIQCLYLSVDIGEIDQLKDTVYARPTPLVLTPEEVERFSKLERLYRQIGLLTELETLSLEVAMSYEDLTEEDDENEVTSRDYSLPGLLSLGDKRKKWPGFLELWAGLTKLQTLRGCFNVTTKETEITVGLRRDWDRRGLIIEAFETNRHLV
ncbi:hypothetical protein BGX29_001487 [Mortierella sp. GBA35]|nr:hypothetical protein BGX29_001487 [Mortierella sp. GBA35]